MKSRAHIKGHPLHPILISFPIAFFSGSFLFDLAGLIMAKSDLWQVAYWLQITGVGLALLAAIPGAIDYFLTVPPKSTGKKRATQHALINIANVALFAGIWFYRQLENSAPYVVLVLETVGIISLAIAGWMGGTLVYRNQIGVDPRYAYAGKWKEEFFKQTNGPVKIAKMNELKTNQMKLVHINQKRIVLAKTENSYVAFDDHCTHRGGSLAGGSMICGRVQCPWHGSQFDLASGQVTAGPAKQSIHTYTITERDGKIFLHLTKLD